MAVYSGTRASIYFGSVDTDEMTYVEAGDSANQMSDWMLTGLSVSNSDKYKLYWKLTHTTNYAVDLYKDSAMTQKVATGNIATATGTVVLSPVSSSGIAGSVHIAYTIDDTDTSNILTPVTTYNVATGPLDMKLMTADGMISYIGGAGSTQINSMYLYGLTESNTDHYKLYYRLAYATGNTTLDLYKDYNATSKVATAVITGGHSGRATISAVSSSGIRGRVVIAHTADVSETPANEGAATAVIAADLQYVLADAADRKLYMWWAEANATLAVKINTSTVIDNAKCSIQYLGGIVRLKGSYVASAAYQTLADTDADAITVENVGYWSVSKMGEANSWNLSISRDIADKSVLGNNGWKEYFPMMRGANVTLDKWFESNNQFYDILGKKVILVLWVTWDDDTAGAGGYTGAGYACYARAKQTQTGAKPTEIVREQLSLDVLSKLYYLDIQ